MTTRAATTRLEPGEHSIDRAKPRQDGVAVFLDWSVRLSDGRLVRRRTQGKTKGEVRRRAKATADELLKTGGGAWKTTDRLSDYIEQVTIPTIEAAPLRESSRKRYLLVLRHLLGRCDHHRHQQSLRGPSIAKGTTFRTLENALTEIAALHGRESAHQARSVLSKYIMSQLKRDNLISNDPIKGERLNLGLPKHQPRTRGGTALTRGEHQSVLDHLLNLDPADGVEAPKRGRWTLENRVAKRRNAIDMTLLQATTGLRASEANSITWQNVEIDGTSVQVEVTPEMSKTHKGRRVPVLFDHDGRVAARLIARRNAAAAEDEHVIGAPTDPSIQWDSRNCNGAVADLYVELAAELGIPLLQTERSHVWRATLNSLLLTTVPEVMRTAFFGHNAATSRQHYTDLTDTSALVSAALELSREPTR